MTWVERALIDGSVVLGADEFQAAVVAESTTFRVDDYLLWVVVVAIPETDILQFLNVARVNTRAENETNTAWRILPCAGHQSTRRVVQYGHNVNLNVAPTSDRFLF